MQTYYKNAQMYHHSSSRIILQTLVWCSCLPLHRCCFFFFILCNFSTTGRITESQNGLGCKGPYDHLVPTALPWAEMPHIAKGFVQSVESSWTDLPPSFLSWMTWTLACTHSFYRLPVPWPCNWHYIQLHHFTQKSWEAAASFVLQLLSLEQQQKYWLTSTH